MLEVSRILQGKEMAKIPTFSEKDKEIRAREAHEMLK